MASSRQSGTPRWRSAKMAFTGHTAAAICHNPSHPTSVTLPVARSTATRRLAIAAETQDDGEARFVLRKLLKLPLGLLLMSPSLSLVLLTSTMLLPVLPSCESPDDDAGVDDEST